MPFFLVGETPKDCTLVMVRPELELDTGDAGGGVEVIVAVVLFEGGNCFAITAAVVAFVTDASCLAAAAAVLFIAGVMAGCIFEYVTLVEVDVGVIVMDFTDGTEVLLIVWLCVAIVAVDFGAIRTDEVGIN